jgi:hypothetical protein
MHSIFVPDENFRIPLEMRGVVSLFYTRQPTIEEIESCRWLMFTSESEWDPHSEDIMQNELAMSLRDISNKPYGICSKHSQCVQTHARNR